MSRAKKRNFCLSAILSLLMVATIIVPFNKDTLGNVELFIKFIVFPVLIAVFLLDFLIVKAYKNTIRRNSALLVVSFAYISSTLMYIYTLSNFDNDFSNKLNVINLFNNFNLLKAIIFAFAFAFLIFSILISTIKKDFKSSGLVYLLCTLMVLSAGFVSYNLTVSEVGHQLESDVLVNAILIVDALVIFCINISRLKAMDHLNDVEIDSDDEALEKRVKQLEKQVEELQNIIKNLDKKEEVVKEEPVLVVNEEPKAEENKEEVEENASNTNNSAKSFVEKLEESGDELKKAFYLIQDHALGYSNVEEALTKKTDNFKYNTQNILKANINKNVLEMYYALDPKELDPQVYNHKDVSHIKAHASEPTLYRITKADEVSVANKLVDELMKKFGIKLKGDFPEIVAKTFEEKLALAEQETKDNIKEISEHFTSYKRVHERLSKKCLSYRYGADTIAKLSIVGKTIRVYLALDPNTYPTNIYHHKDVSNVKAYEDVPMMVKVKSPLGLRKACRLFDEIANKYLEAERLAKEAKKAELLRQKQLEEESNN